MKVQQSISILIFIMLVSCGGLRHNDFSKRKYLHLQNDPTTEESGSLLQMEKEIVELAEWNISSSDSIVKNTPAEALIFTEAENGKTTTQSNDQIFIEAKFGNSSQVSNVGVNAEFVMVEQNNGIYEIEFHLDDTLLNQSSNNSTPADEPDLARKQFGLFVTLAFIITLTLIPLFLIWFVILLFLALLEIGNAGGEDALATANYVMLLCIFGIFCLATCSAALAFIKSFKVPKEKRNSRFKIGYVFCLILLGLMSIILPFTPFILF